MNDEECPCREWAACGGGLRNARLVGALKSARIRLCLFECEGVRAGCVCVDGPFGNVIARVMIECFASLHACVYACVMIECLPVGIRVRACVCVLVQRSTALSGEHGG